MPGWRSRASSCRAAALANAAPVRTARSVVSDVGEVCVANDDEFGSERAQPPDLPNLLEGSRGIQLARMLAAEPTTRPPRTASISREGCSINRHISPIRQRCTGEGLTSTSGRMAKCSQIASIDCGAILLAPGW